ncbi:MAG: alpha/beta fold hydrolase [Gemmatimonas sp.]|jgi:pimeloyl-ACP methyl ester carboxylesterase|uniref:alpha/beta fold hydrolase n=1 Tax=Gemmatimonas sp. TaxID=1962908 RepID=UPI0025C4964F|nr:alpha/beta fold hydrolase [Gemmatimonas sp.]MCA2986993.1 alpha/beta fold hydrolase [Gemmatimonas sp.]MCE2953267.1 alpha/beta hydrolase [Gemmatimonas sp.]
MALGTSILACDRDGAVGPTPDESGRFVASACPKPLPPGLTEGTTVRCGTLTVPENHAVPNGKTIQLSVLILKGTTTVTKDPIVHLQGGPGGNYGNYASVLGGEFGLGTSRATGREVVFFDQRGTGESKPSLTCKDNEDIPACLRRLQAAGSDLAAYNSEESARDVETLRKALGYEKLNLYGQSYGTVLAQTVMRLFPSSVRTAMLEGVSSIPFDAQLPSSPKALESALGRVFEECAADAACRAAYPSPARDLDDIVRAAATAGEDPSGIVRVLTALTQFAQGASYVPYALRALATGDQQKLAALVPVLEQAEDYETAVQQTLALGALIAVNCYDYGPLATTARWNAVNGGARPAFRTAIPEQPLPCALLPTSRVSEAHRSPFASSIPTLLISGSHDSNTPKETADALAPSLSKAYKVVVPGWGHVLLAFGETCSTNIFREFIRDPARVPNTSCLAATKFPTTIP